MGVHDIEEMIQDYHNDNGSEPDGTTDIVFFGCNKDAQAGLTASYSNGVILLVCMECEEIKAQIEVAERGRLTIELGALN